MADAAIELIGDEFGKDRGSKKYFVLAESATIARALAYAIAPVAAGNLVRQPAEAKETGPGTWSVEIPYSTRSTEGVPSVSVEIGVENVKITQSLGTINYPNGTAHNFQGAINASTDSSGKPKVEGTNRSVPTIHVEVTHTLAYNYAISAAFINGVYSLVATTNAAPFWMFGAEEGLFLGVSFSQQAQQPVPVTFKWAISRTERNIVFGANTVPTKPGWRYLWYTYLPDPTNPGALCAKPAAAHLEQVYETASWSFLTNFANPWV